MMLRVLGLILWSAGLYFPTGVSSADDASVVKKYALPERGMLQMSVSGNWDDQLRQPPKSLPPTIAFRARQGKPFEVLATPIWRMRPDVPASTKDSIRQQVERAADAALSQAVEKTIRVIEFVGSSGPGYYFSATDRAPKPGEYKLMTQGILKVSDLVVTFTILTNDGQEQVTRDTLSMLKSAIHIQP